MLLSSTTANTSTATKTTKKVIASDKARKFKESLAGIYTTTDTIYMRSGAGTKHNTMTILPKDTTVTCKGDYSVSGGAKWLYVNVIINNVEYMGFCINKYLKR